jgi:hypothetical protein
MTLKFHLSSDRAVRVGFFAALIAWAMVAGKDLSWDVVNHQLYLPFLWLNGREHSDLFGAGGQSYQNPLGYFPLYGMFRAGMPAWLIGVVLAATHALVVWPLDRIARLFWPGSTAEDFWCRMLALAFCCIAPIFLIHDGTTSIDPFASLMVIWALALTLESGVGTERSHAELRRAGVAGALLGLASAIKLSNAVYAVALCALWLLKWAIGQTGLRRVLAFGTALLLAFAVCAGPWMVSLWHDFGNPIYPLYNNVFHSPYAPPQAITALRFVPAAPWGMVSRLWEMAQLSSFVAFEAFLPDIRPLLAAVAALAAALVLGRRGGWRRLLSRATWGTPGAPLAVATLLMYLLWIRSSGNARYGIPLFVLIGIPLVRATQRAISFRATKIVLLTALLLQGAYYFVEGDRRFTGTAWDSGPYLDYRVPRRLQEQPFLHLTIGVQTSAALALFLAPDGALANPIGQFPLPIDGPLGNRFDSLLAKWQGRTRLLFGAPPPNTKPADIASARAQLQTLLYRLGLDVDWSDCELIEMVSSRSDFSNGELHANHRLQSCAVLYRSARDPVIDQQRADADRVFSILEAACPRVFSPTPFSSEQGLGYWQRHYMNTEAVVTVSPDNGAVFSHFRMFQGKTLGSMADLLAHRVPVECPRIEYHTPT